MANPIKKLASQTAIYGLSSILGRVANYLLLTPLYTNKDLFSVEQFGVITDTYAWVALSIIFFTYGLETGYFRFANKYENEREKVFSTSLISVLTTGIVFVLFFIFQSQNVANWLKYPEHSEYIRYLALIVGLDAIASIPFAKLRLQERPIKFAVIRLSNLGINIGLNFFFYVLCPYYTQNYNYEFINSILFTFYDPSVGVGYVFISNLIASVVTILLLSPVLLKHKWQFDFKLWKKLIIYCLPLLIVGLSGSINQHLDKLIFKFLLPEELALRETGIYGAIYKLSIMITLFIQAYQYAAEPFFFSQSKKTDAKKTYANVLLYFTIITAVAFLGIQFYIDIVKLFIRNPEYYSGLFILPWLLMGAVLFGMYYNLSIWYKLSGKTYYGAIISGVGSVFTLVGNLLLIPFFESRYPGEGYTGAAIVTFGCFLIMTVISYILGQKHYPIPYKLGRIMFYLILAVGLFLTSEFLIKGLDEVLKYILNSVILLAYIGVAFYLEKPRKVVNL